MLTGAQVIVLATPVFLGLIALEVAVGRARGRNTYRLGDTLSSIGLGAMSQVTALFGQLPRIGIYTLGLRAPGGDGAAGVVTLDLAFRFAGLRLPVLLAAPRRPPHGGAVGGACGAPPERGLQPGTALRQTSSGFLLGWVFYLPLALAGVPPLVFGTVALIDLLYQFWVHTQQVGRLGWFDRWFCSPSNHRAHHAVNDRYLDRNYGGILIVWDRLFGTFVEEDDAEPCVYGTRSPLRSFDPLRANLQVYAALAADSWRARSWADKLRDLVQAAGLAAGRRGCALAPARLRPASCAALRPAAAPPRCRGGGGAFRHGARGRVVAAVACPHAAARHGGRWHGGRRGRAVAGGRHHPGPRRAAPATTWQARPR